MTMNQGSSVNAAGTGGLTPQGGVTTQPVNQQQNSGQPNQGQQSGQVGQGNGTAAQQTSNQAAPQAQASAPSGYDWRQDPAYREQHAEQQRREQRLQAQVNDLTQRWQQTQQMLAQREQTFIQALPADQRAQYEQQTLRQELETLRQQNQAYETRMQYQQQIEPVRQQVLAQYGAQALQFVNWDNPLTIGSDIIALPSRLQQAQQAQQWGQQPQYQQWGGGTMAQQYNQGTPTQVYNLPVQGMQQPMGVPTDVNQLAALIAQMLPQLMRDNWQQISNNQVDVGGGAIYSDAATWEAEAQRLRRAGDLAGSIAHQARHPSLLQRR